MTKMFDTRWIFIGYFFLLSLTSYAQVEDDVKKNLEDLDSQIDEFTAEIFEQFENLEIQTQLPADIEVLRRVTKISTLPRTYLYVLPLLTSAFASYALTEHIALSPQSIGLFVGLASSQFVTFSAVLQGLDWAERKSQRTVLEKGLSTSWSYFYRHTRNMLTNWGEKNLIYNPLDYQKIKNYLENILAQRIKAVEFFTQDMNWYDAKIDNDIVMDKAIRLYLKAWMANAYLTILQHSQPKNSVKQSTNDHQMRFRECSQSFARSMLQKPAQNI